MQTKYRAAQITDRPEWISLRYGLWPDCHVERHKLEVEQLLKGEGIVAVAECDGQMAGFAEVSLRKDHVEGTHSVPVPYLEGWFVRANYRGCGIGRGLLDFVERWAAARGFEELASDAEIENSRSIRLHRTLGFTEVGRTVHFVKQLSRKMPKARRIPS
jgi:aminoglycoside 6'-N-acetyltransferase I